MKKVLFGEPMPDKDDPKYHDRYLREVEAGRRFSEKIGFPKLIARIQSWANKNPKGFLAIAFGIVIGCLLINIGVMVYGYVRDSEPQGRATAVEQVDNALRNARHRSN